MQIASRRLALVGVCAFAFALAVSPAITASASAKQSGKQAQASAKKKKKSKSKRGPRGKTGKQGPAGPQGKTGPQGPQGPQGVAGSAVAYGLIDSRGTDPVLVAGKSKNISSVRLIAPGEYCVTGAAGVLNSEHPAIVSVAALGLVDFVGTRVLWEAGSTDPQCAGSTDYVIATVDGAGSALANRSFAIAIL